MFMEVPMFELPEFTTLARQMNETLQGKAIRSGSLGNVPHKFVWYNRTPEEFAQLTAGKVIGEAQSQGRWLFLPLQPGYVMLFGECGGKILYHPPDSEHPQKHHLFLALDDDSALTAMTQMWGAYELYEEGQEQERQYVKGMRPTPVDPAFTLEYFNALLDTLIAEKKRSAKALLTQEQLIPGLGNAIAQDILFRARLHPRHDLAELATEQRHALYTAIVDTVQEAIAQGGRYDEVDLYGQPGGYVRLMDKEALGRPCPECGGTVEKVQYLGGACYYCPSCQR
jgi:formamidopyrimidine-DNA glycosylase